VVDNHLVQALEVDKDLLQEAMDQAFKVAVLVKVVHLQVVE